MKNGTIIGVCISKQKGTSKKNIYSCPVIKGRGLKGDAHSGSGKRQVSLLACETIEKMKPLGKKYGLNIGPGSFAENLTTKDINLTKLSVGTTLKIGDRLVLRIAQIGKECHTGCAIRKTIGDCVMPREGVFAEVLKSGIVKVGDSVEVMASA